MVNESRNDQLSQCLKYGIENIVKYYSRTMEEVCGIPRVVHTVGCKVKMRFKSTEVEGDYVWYGGVIERAETISKGSEKLLMVEIRYDDGATEYVRLPDRDIVFDLSGNQCTMNETSLKKCQTVAKNGNRRYSDISCIEKGMDTHGGRKGGMEHYDESTSKCNDSAKNAATDLTNVAQKRGEQTNKAARNSIEYNSCESIHSPSSEKYIPRAQCKTIDTFDIEKKRQSPNNAIFATKEFCTDFETQISPSEYLPFGTPVAIPKKNIITPSTETKVNSVRQSTNYTSWLNMWEILKDNGWTWVKGVKLEPWVYISPRGDHLMGKEGSDYFNSLYDLQTFAISRLGWTGDDRYWKMMQLREGGGRRPLGCRKRNRYISQSQQSKPAKKMKRGAPEKDGFSPALICPDTPPKLPGHVYNYSNVTVVVDGSYFNMYPKTGLSSGGHRSRVRRNKNPTQSTKNNFKQALVYPYTPPSLQEASKNLPSAKYRTVRVVVAGSTLNLYPTIELDSRNCDSSTCNSFDHICCNQSCNELLSQKSISESINKELECFQMIDIIISLVTPDRFSDIDTIRKDLIAHNECELLVSYIFICFAICMQSQYPSHGENQHERSLRQKKAISVVKILLMPPCGARSFDSNGDESSWCSFLEVVNLVIAGQVRNKELTISSSDAAAAAAIDIVTLAFNHDFTPLHDLELSSRIDLAICTRLMFVIQDIITMGGDNKINCCSSKGTKQFDISKLLNVLEIIYRCSSAILDAVCSFFGDELFKLITHTLLLTGLFDRNKFSGKLSYNNVDSTKIKAKCAVLRKSPRNDNEVSLAYVDKTNYMLLEKSFRVIMHFSQAGLDTKEYMISSENGELVRIVVLMANFHNFANDTNQACDWGQTNSTLAQANLSALRTIANLSFGSFSIRSRLVSEYFLVDALESYNEKTEVGEGNKAINNLIKEAMAMIINNLAAVEDHTALLVKRKRLVLTLVTLIHPDCSTKCHYHAVAAVQQLSLLGANAYCLAALGGEELIYSLGRIVRKGGDIKLVSMSTASLRNFSRKGCISAVMIANHKATLEALSTASSSWNRDVRRNATEAIRDLVHLVPTKSFNNMYARAASPKRAPFSAVHDLMLCTRYQN